MPDRTHNIMDALLLRLEPGCIHYLPSKNDDTATARDALVEHGLLKPLNWCDYRLTPEGEAERERVRRNSDG